MTETVTSLESVLTELRAYLTERLAVLDSELEAAHAAAAELSEQLTRQQDTVKNLVASRELLVGKLSELDGAVATASEAATVSEEATASEVPASSEVAKARSSRRRAAKKVPPEITEAVERDAEVGTVQSAADAKQPSSGAGQVLEFLRTHPGVHKVAEIAAGVNGPQPSGAQAQAVRRALASLAKDGLAEKSLQSGTAFYSAVTESDASAKPVRADRAKIVATLRAAEEPQSAAEVSRSVMGDEWKSSDATNFRNVLKSLAREGLVTSTVGPDNRARYTAPAAS